MPNRPLALVIDHDRDAACAALMRLAAHDYEVITASNTRQGVRIAVEQIPDVIVLDANMPEIGSATAAGWLLQQEETRHIPLVIVFEGPKEWRHASCWGANQLVKKQYGSQRFTAAVTDAVHSATRHSTVDISNINRPLALMSDNVARAGRAISDLSITPTKSAVKCRNDKQPKPVSSSRRRQQWLAQLAEVPSTTVDSETN